MLLALLLTVSGCAAHSTAPAVIDGRIDLSAWNFDVDGDVALLGTWEICWNQLLEPEDDCPSGWSSVPVRGFWSQSEVGSPFGGKGYATYRLRIQLPAKGQSLSLVVGGPHTAHRLWIDGLERGELGVVGRTADTTQSHVVTRVYALNEPADEVEVRIQVANFEFRSGGLRRVWFLGRPDSIQQGLGRAMLREGTVFSVGVIVGLGYLVLFALRPAEQARGYFGLVALSLGLRAVPASISSFGELMAPWMTWDLSVRLEYLGTALACFAAAGYALTKVPDIMPPRTMRLLQLVALALGVFVLAAPAPLMLATLPLQMMLPMVLIALIVLCYGRAWARGLSEARITTITALLYVGFVTHDILRSIWSGLGATIELFPYALSLWILAEAFQLLQRFYESFERVELLSDELTEANFELQETESAIVRFVPFDFLRTLGKATIRDVNAGDHARETMSVLYCGFHWDSKSPNARDPESDFAGINELIGRVEHCIHHHGGFMNEYRGDGFLAFFPAGPAEAVAAAIEILTTTRAFREDTMARRQSAIEVRIGIDTGPVLLGTIGTQDHLVRTIVGQPVENAPRIERLTPIGESSLLISAATRLGIGDECRLIMRRRPDATLDDRSGPIEIDEVLKEGAE